MAKKKSDLRQLIAQRALQRGFALKRALAHVIDPKREEDSQHG